MQSASAWEAPSPHSFHIPVMGIGFTLDTPLKVAPYGISSVISLVDDVLVEQLRRYYCEARGEPYQEITDDQGDVRAKRITQYMNLLDRMTRESFERVKTSSLDDPMGVRRYCALLPDGAPLKVLYQRVTSLPAGPERACLEAELRNGLTMGSIDANIMTKLDRAVDNRGNPKPDGESDAVAALRGFSDSTVEGAMILSAGMNPKLFAVFGQYEDYFAKGGNPPKKRVIIKVSDFRSAQVQGRFLARRGVWPYEFRIESGLNCGGHAFPTDGYLFGPILEEFKENREQLQQELLATYEKALRTRGEACVVQPRVRITVQGGIGTPSEDRFLREHYGMDATGWGSPFLLVPEVVNVSRDSLDKLKAGGKDRVVLTWSSPLGVPFWSLRDSGSDLARRARIAAGRPGSACPKGYLALHNEHGKVPLCTASRGYQKKVLAALGDVTNDTQMRVKNRLMEPQCICHDLGGCLKIRLNIEPDATPAICPGPNLRYFEGEHTLEAMIDHIYGRTDLLGRLYRSNLFVNELELYIDFLRDRISEIGTPLESKKPDVLRKYRSNLYTGIEYYRKLVSALPEAEQARFLDDLAAQESALDAIAVGDESEPPSEARPAVPAGSVSVAQPVAGG